MDLLPVGKGIRPWLKIALIYRYIMRVGAFSLSLLACAGLFPQSNPRTRMPEDVAIFAIRHDGPAPTIDPIVLVHYGSDQRFKTIPALNSPILKEGLSESDVSRIENTFYKPGTLLSMFSGGEKVGMAKVRASNIEGLDGGCVDLSAVISEGGLGKARLASNTGSEISGHASTRRSAAQEEISTLRQLAIQWLRDYGLDKELLESGKLGQVTSTVLRTGAGRALIGRFDVASKEAVHRLFAIAEMNRGAYRLTLTDLEVQRDVEDGTDKTEREYLDQLDINNDGVDEVIASASHYESWTYSVWVFRANNGLWRKAYTGGGGCC
jgi:hypothetical protein